MLELPDKILVSNQDIDMICKEAFEKNSLEKKFDLFLGLVIPAVISIVLDIFNYKTWGWTETVYTSVFACIIVYTIYLYRIKSKKINTKTIAEQIRENAYKDAAYTAVFIIARIRTDQDNRQKIEVLVQNKESWNCDFLPYWELDKERTLEEQKEILRDGLASRLNIRSQSVRIFHLEGEGCSRIKKTIPTGKDNLYYHEFYTVSINSNLENILRKNQKWRNIDDLENDVNIVRTNSDVIDNLSRLKNKIIDSFHSDSRSENMLKILWNITDKCMFQCKICATYSENKKELTESEKARVLLSLVNMKDSILELNFAGGDPLCSDDSKKLIKYAMNIFDKNKISITTTGVGVDQLTENEKMIFLNNCVLSIDPVHFNEEGVRNSLVYNKRNAQVGRRDREYMTKLRINIPILQTDLTEETMHNFAQIINKIKPDEVSLLRLMPVGKQISNLYPTDYDPLKFIDEFRKYLNPQIPIHIHCSLRCLYQDSKEKCTMVNNKIGIDCAGNVFACCWAGYLDYSLDDNPFYLGNLLENDLEEIMQSRKVQELREEINRDECSIFH